MSAEELRGEPLERVIAARTAMNSVLTNARMVCTDLELHRYIQQQLDSVRAFGALFHEPLPRSDREQQRKELIRLERDGLQSFKRFGEALDAFVKRGFWVYASRGARRSLTAADAEKTATASGSPRRP
jgi:hypothetical protein